MATAAPTFSSSLWLDAPPDASGKTVQCELLTKASSAEWRGWRRQQQRPPPMAACTPQSADAQPPWVLGVNLSLPIGATQIAISDLDADGLIDLMFAGAAARAHRQHDNTYLVCDDAHAKPG